MIRNINIGQYLNRKSVIHSADPRVKLFLTVVNIVSIMFLDNIFQYCVAVGALFVYLAFAKIGVGTVIKSLKPILFLLAFTSLFNLFGTPGNVIFKMGFVSITYEGVISMLRLIVRLFLLVVGATTLTYTTTPSELTQGIEKAFGFLSRFKVPVSEFAMMMTIALRFIPTLLDEADKIIKAQISRGADLENGNIFKKIRAYIPIVIPLIINAITRAIDLATAMEVRCYNSENKRTKMKELCYTKNDLVLYFAVIIYFAIIISLGII